MWTHSRTGVAVLAACAILLLLAFPAYPSYNSDAGRKYAVASQRLEDLKKSPKKKKYRSYWIDCIRTFEAVERKYPKSTVAADSCFDRAGIFQELYQYTKVSRDIDESIALYGRCQSAYPKHSRAAEALFHIVDLSLAIKKNSDAAAGAYDTLAKLYADSAWTGKAKALMNPPVRSSRRKRRQEPELRKMPVAVISAPNATAPSVVVHKVRYWSGGAYTRIVIEQDGAGKFLTQELKKPDRLVFDLLNSRLGPSVDREPLPVNDGILRQVRLNQYAPDIVRVVLDLASIKSYVAFPLHDPERIVIDVTGEGGKAPEAAPARPEPETQQTQSAETGGTASIVKPEPRLPVVPTVKDNDGERLSLSRQLGLKVKTVAIDAGHGGHDPGAIGRSGLKEKQVTLEIAKKLAVLVKERLGCNVVMTRDRDVFIPLDQRPFIAKSNNADLFVSIHINANRKRKTKGIETYVQGLKASDREAMATAARENAMSTKSLGELDNEVERMLKDLKIDNKIEESIQLAGVVQSSLVTSVKPQQTTVVNHGVKSAFFYVLMNTNIPSILAEVGFISNPEEEKLLKTDTYRQAIAEALFQGIKKYVEGRGPQIAGMQ